VGRLFEDSKLWKAVEAGLFFIEEDKAVSRFSLSKKIFNQGFDVFTVKAAYDILNRVYLEPQPRKKEKEEIEKFQEISEKVIWSAKNNHDPNDIAVALHREGYKYEEIKIVMRGFGFRVISKGGGGGLIITGYVGGLSETIPNWSFNCPILT
jgi:hypothetical protein